MIAVATGLLGLIIGSFLNVFVLRHGARSLGGRSECLSCGATLAWFDMVPVGSWLALRGRCRRCGSRISVQYPLVEASTACAFAALGYAMAPSLMQGTPGVLVFVLSLAAASLLVAIAAYDTLHTIIPDRWAYAFAAIALGIAVARLLSWGGDPVVALIAGPIAALPLFSLWLVSRGRWMGLGDAKLALGIGWLLGPVHGIVAIFFAFMIGAAVTVPLVALSSPGGQAFIARITPTRSYRAHRFRFTMKSEIPFGPFLIASCFILWLTLLLGIPLPF